jgi:hypothetical protein
VKAVCLFINAKQAKHTGFRGKKSSVQWQFGGGQNYISKLIIQSMVDAEPQVRSRWEDRYTVKKTVTFTDSHGWAKVIIGERKSDKKPIIRIKRFRNWYSIPSESHWKIIKKLLENAASELNWSEEITDDKIKELLNKLNELKAAKEVAKGKIVAQKETITDLINQMGKVREQQFSLFLSHFRSDLTDFKKLLDDPTKEHALQIWLYEHPWLFGPEYLEGTKEELLRNGSRIDFLMKRFDTFYDVFELKLPSHPLFLDGGGGSLPNPEISRTYVMTAEVKDALSQVMGYLEKYGLDKANIQWERGIRIHKPKGIVVIGRSSEINRHALRTLNSYLHGIEIYTYDDLLEFGKNFVKLIEHRDKK